MDEAPRTHRRRRGLLALLMAGTALISVTGAVMSLAIFTDTVSANNGFTVATVKIGINPATTIFTVPAYIYPGDTFPTGVAGQAVTVTNAGTVQMRYAVSATSTDDGKHLNTVLGFVVAQPDGNSGASCSLMTGTALFGTVALPAVIPTAGLNLVGSPATGPQTGDRTLAGGASETLCFKATLPSGTTSAYEGATSTYTFTFTAEQTYLNP